jgi:hypothetical protein
MTRVADGLVLAVYLGLALEFDPASLDPLSPRLPLALLGFSAALAAHGLARPSGLAWRPVDAVLAAGLGLHVAWAALSIAPWAAGPALVQVALAYQAYLLGRLWWNRPGRLVLLARLSLVAVLLAGVAFRGSWRKPIGPDHEASVPTSVLVGSLGNPDYTAAWLLLATPVALARPASALPGAARALSGPARAIFGIAGCVGLGWTLSRGAWFAAAAAMAFFAIAARASPAPASRKRTPTPASGRTPVVLSTLVDARFACGLALVLLVGAGAIAGSPADRAKLSDPATASKRLELWAMALALAAEHPFAGHGPGLFGELYARLRPADFARTGMPSATEFAHNLPLQVAVETGLLGLALLVTAVALAAWPWSRRARTPDRDPGHGHVRDETASMAAVAVAAFLLHNLVSVTAYVLPVMLYAALTAGVLVGRSITLVDPEPEPERLPTGPPASPARARLATWLILALFALLDLSLAPWALARHRALHLAGEARTHLARACAAPARASAATALQEAPGIPAVRYLLAGALAEAGHPAESLVHYLVLESQSPGHGQQAYNRGRVLLDLERPEAARRALQDFLAREPDSFEGRYAMAEACAMTGELARSRAELARARELAPPDPKLAERLRVLSADLERHLERLVPGHSARD